MDRSDDTAWAVVALAATRPGGHDRGAVATGRSLPGCPCGGLSSDGPLTGFDVLQAFPGGQLGKGHVNGIVVL